jgi:LmbE family N-acetylglucosaminyl deacetylase
MEASQNHIPKSAMVIMAHPDDAEFTVAGTVAKWAQTGCEVVYVLCTSGNAGTHEPGMTRDQIAAIREDEQRAACRVLGVKDVVFLRYDDGTLQPTLELRRDLVRQIRRFKPEAIITEDPTALFYGDDYINHPDHRAAGQAALDAVAPAAAMPLLWPEEGEPHRVRQVYVGGANKPNVWVDLSETLIEQKIEALRQHKSQMGDWDPSEMIRRWAAETGQEKGLAYAESFRRIRLEPPPSAES